MNPTRAEIDLDKLEWNFDQVKSHVHRTNPNRRIKICGVVKANAYGHGIEPISKKLVELGVDYLGVANYDEAFRLRELIPKTPILVFGTLFHTKLEPEKYVSKLLKYNLIATVASLDTAKYLDYYSYLQKRKFKVHIEVDTGLRRIGFDVKRAFKNVEQICSLKNIYVEGIFTHFATSELRDKSFVRYQLSKFKELLHRLERAGIKIPIVHTANSGAILDMKDAYFNLVRPGLLLYGYYPSHEIRNKIDVRPIMNLKSRVMFVKRVDSGTSISYGRQFYTDKKTYIGSIPVGYGDGYWRIFGNKAKVLINKKFYPVVGAITMDWTMVNLGTNNKIKVGDDVLLMGQEDGISVGADMLAKIAGTIPYETLCAVADRVPRVYLNK
jgi:alanine racemase